MSLSISSNLTQRACTWTLWKAYQTLKRGPWQSEDDGVVYTIWFYDGPEVYVCTIWKGTVPDSVIAGGYSQAQNDADEADWVTNYLPNSNSPLHYSPLTGDFNDPSVIRRFGQLTSLAVPEVLLYPRVYAEPAAQAQRSIISTSATDSNALATGARKIRITYLDSNYVLKTEDVFTNGLTGVNTAGTDLRFIESMEVIQGTEAVGAIRLMTGLAGAGTEIIGIGAASGQSFACHHYVPAGKKCFILSWNGVVSDDVSFKLKVQDRVLGNLVERIADLVSLLGITAGSFANFGDRTLMATVVPEKTYIRATVVPGQATSTIIRGVLNLWEIPQ